MSNRSDGLMMSQARHQSTIHDLENTAFGSDRSIGGLIENAPHMATAFRGTMALRYFRALLISGTSTHPGGQVLGRSKGSSRGPDFGDDLLRGIDSQTRYFRQSLDGVFVLSQEGRYLLLQLVPLLFDELQSLQRHFQ